MPSRTSAARCAGVSGAGAGAAAGATAGGGVAGLGGAPWLAHPTAASPRTKTIDRIRMAEVYYASPPRTLASGRAARDRQLRDRDRIVRHVVLAPRHARDRGDEVDLLAVAEHGVVAV